jgi:hypothetical protein
MEEGFLHKVYDFVNHIIHLDDLKLSPELKDKRKSTKYCPITGLDITMQPKNSKFLSYTGIKWYYKHDYKTYKRILLPRIHRQWLKEDIDKQFREIAHDIRNADSNPRNNTKRAIRKILEEKGSLFNNMDLIDKNKLKEAGYM